MGVCCFRVHKTLRVNHLPLERDLAVQTWTSNHNPDAKVLVTWLLDVCRSREMPQNLNLKVSNVCFAPASTIFFRHKTNPLFIHLFDFSADCLSCPNIMILSWTMTVAKILDMNNTFSLKRTDTRRRWTKIVAMRQLLLMREKDSWSVEANLIASRLRMSRKQIKYKKSRHNLSSLSVFR